MTSTSLPSPSPPPRAARGTSECRRRGYGAGCRPACRGDSTRYRAARSSNADARPRACVGTRSILSAFSQYSKRRNPTTSQWVSSFSSDKPPDPRKPWRSHLCQRPLSSPTVSGHRVLPGGQPRAPAGRRARSVALEDQHGRAQQRPELGDERPQQLFESLVADERVVQKERDEPTRPESRVRRPIRVAQPTRPRRAGESEARQQQQDVDTELNHVCASDARRPRPRGSGTCSLRSGSASSPCAAAQRESRTRRRTRSTTASPATTAVRSAGTIATASAIKPSPQTTTKIVKIRGAAPSWPSSLMYWRIGEWWGSRAPARPIRRRTRPARGSRPRQHQRPTARRIGQQRPPCPSERKCTLRNTVTSSPDAIKFFAVALEPTAARHRRCVRAGP